MHSVVAPFSHTRVNVAARKKSSRWKSELPCSRNGNSKWAANAAPQSKSEQLYGELRKHLNKVPGLRVLSVPAQLAENRVKKHNQVYVGRNLAFESEWIRYGRVTLVDAGEEAQVCCGAMYLDCMADGPPLVFDALISGSPNQPIHSIDEAGPFSRKTTSEGGGLFGNGLSTCFPCCVGKGGDFWMVSMDFVPLFEDVEYRRSYMAGLGKIKRKHGSLLRSFPKSFFAEKRWTSSKLVFSSGSFHQSDSQEGEEEKKFRELLGLFSDVILHYLNVAHHSWESSRGKHPPGIVLEKQLAFLEWMETTQNPSSVVIRSHFGVGWFDLVLKSLWKDTHGLSRWGGPLQTRSAYHEVYEDVLKASKGNVQEANEKLIATGLQPLEYLYFNPNPNMWDFDDL